MGVFFPPTYATPDGRNLTRPYYDEYMANVYNPQQDFNASAAAPIPGVPTAPTSGLHPNPTSTQGLLSGVGSQWMNQNMSSGDWTSLLPAGRAPPPAVGGGPAPMSPAPPNPGPYGQQAMQMAGLLAPQAQQPPPQGYPNGLLGGKRPFHPGGK